MPQLLPPASTPEEFAAAHRARDGWDPAVDAIARAHGLPGGPVARFTTGTQVVLAVGDAHVVKLYPPFDTAAEEIEWAALEALHGRLPVETPAPLARGDLEGWRYLAMTRVEGVAWERAFADLPRGARDALARELGAAVAAMHALPPPDAPPALAIDWRAFLAEQTWTSVERQQKRGLDARWLEQIPRFLNRYGEPVAEDPRRSLLHTELGPGHVLVAERDGAPRVGGLIDVADAMVGPPEYDLTAVGIFVTRGDAAAFGAFLDGYAMDRAAREGLAERVMIHALLHRYSNLRWYLEQCPPPPDARTLEDVARAWWGAR